MSLMQRIVSRPIGAMVIAVAAAVLGILAWQNLSVALLPPIESPIITVRVDRSGASALELEEQVLIPLQDLLATLPGLLAMQGRSEREQVEVQLVLAADGRLRDSIERLRERLASWRRPRGVGEPRILRYDPGAEPLLRLVLRPQPGGPDIEALALAAREDLLPRLEGRPAIASALLRGASDLELSLRPRYSALQAAGLTMDDIAQAVRDGVESRSVGTIRSSDGVQNLYLRGPATLPEHLPDLPLRGGLRLGDVVESSWEIGESDELAQVLLASDNSESALLIEVLMQADAAVVAAADDVRATLDSLAPRRDAQSWDFHGGDLHLFADRSQPIRQALDEVIYAMIIGALLAGLVLLLFLRSLWSALVVFLSVPLSVCGAFLVLAQLNVGINLMSLGGLALGIGMLVDNAIVVIESARRRLKGNEGTEQRQAAVALGCGEVASAVIAATATTLAVFIPLIFAPGIIGDLLFDLAWAVAASLAASLAVALLIAPPLLALGAVRTKEGWSPPSVHAGYDLALPGITRSWQWWFLSLAPLLVLIALPWQPGSGRLISAALALWTAIALLILDRHGNSNSWRFWLRIPLRLGNFFLCWLRWWLLMLVSPIALGIGALAWISHSMLVLFRPFDGLLRSLGQRSSAIYVRCLDRVLFHPFVSVLLALILLAIGLSSASRLSIRLLPESTHRNFLVDIDLPRSYEVQASRAWAAGVLEELARQEPGLQGIALAGEDPRFAPTLERRGGHQLRLLLMRRQTATDSQAEGAWLRSLESQLLAAGALSAAAWPPPLVEIAGQQGQAFAIALTGASPQDLRSETLQWLSALRLLGAQGLRSSATAQHDEILVQAHSRRLQEAGMTWRSFQERLRQASELISIEGFRPRYDGFTPSGSTLPIRIHGPLRDAPLSQLAALDMGDGSRPLPLSQLADIQRLSDSGSILHRDGQRVATLMAVALPAGMTAEQTIAQLSEQHPLPAGMRVLNYGLESVDRAQIGGLLSLLGLAVFLVLVVMAVQFEDLAQPLLVLLAVPMAISGALPALAFTGHGINSMSGIGLVVLAGICVNNAIVLVTTANLRRSQGLAIKDAIAQAAHERLRPIAMTTLTTVLALFPLALGWGEAAQLRAPLAVAVIGGMISSTFLILLVLPSIMLVVSPQRHAGAQ